MKSKKNAAVLVSFVLAMNLFMVNAWGEPRENPTVENGAIEEAGTPEVNGADGARASEEDSDENLEKDKESEEQNPNPNEEEENNSIQNLPDGDKLPEEKAFNFQPTLEPITPFALGIGNTANFTQELTDMMQSVNKTSPTGSETILLTFPENEVFLEDEIILNLFEDNPNVEITLRYTGGGPLTIKCHNNGNIMTPSRHFRFKIDPSYSLTLKLENIILDGWGVGGGIDIRGYTNVYNSGTFILDGATIQNGFSGTLSDGGGVAGWCNLVIKNCEFYKNFTYTGGGGVAQSGNYTLTVTDSVFKGNIANRGSAVDNFGTMGASTMKSCIVEGNQAMSYGAVYSESYMEISDCKVIDNIADFDAGGIQLDNGGKIIDSTVNDNRTGRYGGGVLGKGHVAIEDSTITGNTSGQYGGGVYMPDASDELILSNVEIHENTAKRDGGGVLIRDYDKLTLNNVTFWGNLAGVGYDIPSTGYPWAGIQASVPFTFIINNYDIYWDNTIPQPQVYVAVFKMNDGTNKEVRRIRIEAAPMMLGLLFPADPVWEGHIFLEWNTEPDGSGYPVVPISPLGGYKNEIIYALWEEMVVIPGIPRNFQAIPGNRQVKLEWDVPASDGGSPIIKYKVSKDDGASWIDVVSGTAYTYENLINGQSYTFQVCAVNGVGEGPAAVITAIPLASGGGNGGRSQAVSDPVVRFYTNGGSDIGSITVKNGEKLEQPKSPVREGYTFTGWYTDKELTQLYDFNTAVGKSITLYAGWQPEGSHEEAPEETPQDIILETVEYPAYISGYPDGSFQPDAPITWAEGLVMLTSVTASGTGTAAGGQWYEWALPSLPEVVQEYLSGSFEAGREMTRGEFMFMALAYLNIQPQEPGVVFSDIEAGHWAEGYIQAAWASGFISGYPDGTFQPDNPISRAEAVVIINNISGRDSAVSYTNTPVFTDVPATHWAYEAVGRASSPGIR